MDTSRSGRPLAGARSYARALAAILLSTTAWAAEPLSLHGRAMGTTWTVRIVQPVTPLDPARITESVGNRLEELEQQFSTYRPDSEVSRFNASRSTEWVTVSREIAEVALLSRRISDLTQGAFDVTVAPLVQVWGFGPERRTGAPPAEAAIAAARQRVDWRRLESRANPPALRKTDSAVTVDFSSLAKGYAADSVDELLSSLGAANHFVQIGGDVKTRGVGPAGAGWRTGIEEPREGSRAVACVLALASQALSTSGDYRNFVTLAGQRYGHIIDPRTGRPAASDLAAVSVVHESCAWSSALATALFVLGPYEGFRLAQRENLAVAFFVREGAAFVRRETPEFRRLSADR